MALPLLPPLPDLPHRAAASLADAFQGHGKDKGKGKGKDKATSHPRILIALGTPAELEAALATLPGDAAGQWQSLRALAPVTVPGPCTFTALVGSTPVAVHLGLLSPGAATFEVLTLAGRLVRAAGSPGPGTAIVLAGTHAAAAEALWAAWVAAQYPTPSLRSKPAGKPAPRSKAPAPVTTAITLGLTDTARRTTQAMERGAALARWLTALPGNHLTPALFRKRALALAKQRGWTATVMDQRALARAGAGAFLAVAQGNDANDACLVRVQYRPRGARGQAPVALVGKGVCFDTGGINVKGHRGMLDMHADMAGSAVALGTLLALDELGHPAPVDAWLALAENHSSPRAYKPQDVVVAANGTTIQVIHTDAEGRMLLADALALAGRSGPRMIVDFATLTGACIGALTERYAGLFTNRLVQREGLEAVGRRSGERVWCFPMDADFDQELESKVADVIQCPVEGKGDHIYAARFLQRFIPAGLPWLHLDLAPAHRAGGLAHVGTDFTGFGVRYATCLLQDEALLADLAGTTLED